MTSVYLNLSVLYLEIFLLLNHHTIHWILNFISPLFLFLSLNYLASEYCFLCPESPFHAVMVSP